MLQAGVLPKSCLEAEAKEVPNAPGASLSFLTRRVALQICIEEQQGETSSLLFSVDARADVKVNAPPPPPPILFPRFPGDFCAHIAMSNSSLPAVLQIDSVCHPRRSRAAHHPAVMNKRRRHQRLLFYELVLRTRKQFLKDRDCLMQFNEYCNIQVRFRFKSSQIARASSHCSVRM